MFWKVLDTLRVLEDRHSGEFKKVLDVGSRNINGSVKDVLKNSKIIGIDMIDGDDVDIVLNGHDLMDEFTPNSFDLVTCCETLEHDDNFWLTVENMRKLVKPGGYLYISTPGINFFRHDFPYDYYRFTEEVFTHYFFKSWEDVFVENYTDSNSKYDNKPNNVTGWARKPK